ncbi:hypothetical protein ADK41_07010 [Streptomyces caelestis]|uniref:Uncharacterized protein n=1 Tax=Streptomyces caelestis TaxID=36816 RepID=A0A0M8QSP2_9ACTN|nr:hypothetical protein [Streptomyces sp. XY152]KOT42577.1 hypothetical protein ADK41_07010 [Streptomyces caelestis]KOV29935.1 hypothetical protein ADK58_08575 [Streptomyces sp. XY152]
MPAYTGVQARFHARAICRVRPTRQIRFAGRDPAKAVALAEELPAVLVGEARAVPTCAEALDGADIAAATTHTVEPVIRRSRLTLLRPAPTPAAGMDPRCSPRPGPERPVPLRGVLLHAAERRAAAPSR